MFDAFAPSRAGTALWAAPAHDSVKLQLVAYSTPKAAYDALIPAFQKTKAGKGGSTSAHRMGPHKIPKSLFTIRKLGGWTKVTKEFFDPRNGLVTKIERDHGVSP